MGEGPRGRRCSNRQYATTRFAQLKARNHVRDYFDNGAYVSSTFEDEIECIQVDVASLGELFGTFDKFYIFATTGALSTNEEWEDNNTHILVCRT